MNLRQVEALVWLARLRSFSAAATQLHTTQPAITLRIQELEREMGATLFDRSRRGVSPTAEGRRCIALAEQILALSAELRGQAGAAVRGRAAVGVSEVIAHTWLPALFAAMDRAYPDVQMDVTIDTTPALLTELERGTLDVVLAGAHQLTTTRAVIDLGQVPFVWLGRERPRGRRPPFHPRDFEGMRVITWPRASAIHQSVEDWFRRNGANPVQRITCNTAATMATLAAAGLGVTLLPEIVVRPLLDSGQLCILPVKPALAPMRYWAVHVPERRGSLGKAVGEVARTVTTFR